MDEMIRVMACSIDGCQRPATWRMGTWWACDEHVKDYQFGGLDGYTVFGTSFRLTSYALPYPGMSEEWMERTTVEVESVEIASLRSQ